MIKLYSQSDFNTAKSNDRLSLQCHHCNKKFLVQKKRIIYELKHEFGLNMYCSKSCANHYKKQPLTILYCMQCNAVINRQKSAISKNNFCSCSCAAKYNNTHKITGIRRSKLEVYIENKLKSLYPNLEILFNDKQTINSELDIYIPSLKLAFELNGLFHYEPIFGQDKFNKIKNNDHRKFAACNENNISLCIIDTSQQKYFKELTSKKYLDIITSIINKSIIP